jgi:hypothetical protein
LHQVVQIHVFLVPQDTIILSFSFHVKFKRSFKAPRALKGPRTPVLGKPLSPSWIPRALENFTYFVVFLKSSLKSCLCCQRNIFLVTPPIFFILCSNPGTATLALKQKTKQPRHIVNMVFFSTIFVVFAQKSAINGILRIRNMKLE